MRKNYREQKICVRDGKVWERSELHLKSMVHDFSRFNLAKLVELDLLKHMVA